jgi:hypothetical protein
MRKENENLFMTGISGGNNNIAKSNTNKDEKNFNINFNDNYNYNNNNTYINNLNNSNSKKININSPEIKNKNNNNNIFNFSPIKIIKKENNLRPKTPANKIISYPTINNNNNINNNNININNNNNLIDINISKVDSSFTSTVSTQFNKSFRIQNKISKLDFNIRLFSPNINTNLNTRRKTQNQNKNNNNNNKQKTSISNKNKNKNMNDLEDTNFFQKKDNNNNNNDNDNEKKNKIPKKENLKITQKLRETMQKIVFLHDDISKIKPVNEDDLIKLSKTNNFNRKVFNKNGVNYRGQKNQENFYEHITSNFRKEEIDIINKAYFKENLIENLNEENNTNNYYCNMINKNNIFSEKNQKKNFFLGENKEKIIMFKKSSSNLKEKIIDLKVDNEKIIKKKKLSNNIKKIEDEFTVKNADFKVRAELQKKKQEELCNLISKAKKDLDLDELKHLVNDSIKEFKKTRGFIDDDFYSLDKLSKIHQIKYDLFNFIKKK